MRSPILFLLVPLAACTAGTPSPIVTQPSTPAGVHETSTSTEFRIAADDRARGDTVALHPDSAFAAALSIYRALGVPLRTEDPAGRVLASRPFTAPRELLGQRLGRYVDCGMTMTGPRVDRWRVTLELTTAVRAEGTRARVGTLLTGSARPSDGVSTDPVRCVSTGALEREIVRLVRVRVGS